MRLPAARLTVGQFLGAVAVIGLDVGLVRAAQEADLCEPCMSRLTLPALVFVPPLSLLFVAATSAGLGIIRRGWASSFSTGYLLLGGLASLGVCLDFAAGTNLLAAIEAYIEGVLDPSRAPGVPETLVRSRSYSVFDGWAGEVLLIAICWLPQVAIAMIGGGLACRCGLAVVLKGGGTSPRTQTPVSGDS